MTTDTVAVWAEARRPSDSQPVMGKTSSPSGLPWPHNAEDLRHFREATRGRVLVMGHTTFRLLPAVLKSRAALRDRPMVVLSAAKNRLIDDYPGLDIQPIRWAHSEHSAQHLLASAGHWFDGPPRGIAVIGGRAVIELFAPLCDRLEVTFIKEPHEGDVPAPSVSVFDTFHAAVQTPGESVDFVTFTKE